MWLLCLVSPVIVNTSCSFFDLTSSFSFFLPSFVPTTICTVQPGFRIAHYSSGSEQNTTASGVATIRYATYLLAQRMEGGERMVAFTRILHRTSEDMLMNEV